MKKLLVIIDMQNDFIDGSLGTPEAQAIVPKVVEKIKNWDGDIAYTQDTHYNKQYLNTNEGRHLPIKHCICGTSGHDLAPSIYGALQSSDCRVERYIKETFGSIFLPRNLRTLKYDRIEICGLCTDICVITNALSIKTYCDESDVVVDSSCCAGTTPENHEASLKVMRSCQIEII